MADKFRTTYPVSISFSNGELPPATKLSALGSQAKSGLAILESAIGDLWNQSGDELLRNTSISQNATLIPSVARMIGLSRLINPRVPRLNVIQEYTHQFDTAVYEAVLPFPPEIGNTMWDWSSDGNPPWNSISPVNSLSDVKTGTQWYVDGLTGVCRFATQVTSVGSPGVFLRYKPYIYGDFGDTGWNVIPDPRVDPSYGFGCVKIEYVNGTDNADGYYISLPPRGPLSTDWDYSIGIQNNLSSPLHTLNFSTTPNSGNRTLYQSDTVDASTVLIYSAHYRYSLPDFITDEWSPGGYISDGLMYLWDPTGTGSVIEGVSFLAATPTKKWKVVASGTGLETYLHSITGQTKYPDANLVSSAEDTSMYPAGGLYLIVVGNSLSIAISRAMDRVIQHTHMGSGAPENRISHSYLIDNFDPEDSTGSLFNHSALDNDWHPQYLHRKGLIASGRDKYKGAMLGTFLMGSSSSANNHDNLSASSFGIQFGSSTTGQVLRYNPTMGDTGALSITGGDVALEESGTRYHQGEQNHWIFPNFVGYPRDAGFGTWVFDFDATFEPCFRSTGAGNPLMLVVTEWPQNMKILQIAIDCTAGGLNPIEIHPARLTWSSVAGNPKGLESFWGLQTGMGAADDHLETLVAGRDILIYTPTTMNPGGFAIANDWNHINHQLTFRIISGQINDYIYGIRLYVNYTSVAPYTP